MITYRCRFDIEFEAAVPVFMNLSLYMRFLKLKIDANKDDSTLDQNLFITLGSLECVAAIQARAIFFLKVIAPLRFFANSSALGFSPVDMGRPLAALLEFLSQANVDGSMFFNKALDIFDGFEDCPEEKAIYDEWKDFFAKRKGKTVDGSMKVNIDELVKNALFEPNRECQAAHLECVACLEQYALGFLQAMGDTPMADYVAGGVYAPGTVTGNAKAAMAGAHSHSGNAESTFGTHKHLEQKTFPGIEAYNAMGMTVASMNGTFDSELVVKEERMGQARPTSRFDELPEKNKISILLCAKQMANSVAKVDRAEKSSFIEHRKQSLEEKANATMVRQVAADETTSKYFEMLRWTSHQAVDRELRKIEGERAKVEALKEQARIRTKGYRWTDLQFPFSTNGKARTVEELTSDVKGMIAKEAGRAPPPTPPAHTHRTFRLDSFGTPTVEALKLREESCWSPEELAEVREQQSAKRELAAAEREHEKHDQFAIEQPESAPELAVGMKIEVLTQLQQTDENDELKFYNQWLAATVLQASTGEEKRPAKNGRLIAVPKGYFYLSYDDGAETWEKLNADDFNCARKGSWRLDLDERENHAEEHAESEDEGQSGPESASETESEFCDSDSEGGGAKDSSSDEDGDIGAAVAPLVSEGAKRQTKRPRGGK